MVIDVIERSEHFVAQFGYFNHTRGCPFQDAEELKNTGGKRAYWPPRSTRVTITADIGDVEYLK
jgi:hypothetical protein